MQVAGQSLFPSSYVSISDTYILTALFAAASKNNIEARIVIDKLALRFLATASFKTCDFQTRHNINLLIQAPSFPFGLFSNLKIPTNYALLI
jgi:hypothetical protein